jgi:CO/xanthine dehydrogenase Mo-binding subunit
MPDLQLSRRTVLKSFAAAGIAVRVGLITREADAVPLTAPLPPPPRWLGENGRPRFRLEALAKVTGEKTFARDYRARDLPGWPAHQSHALLIRATRADSNFQGLDLSILGPDLQPDKIVLAADLEAANLIPPAAEGDANFYGDHFLVPQGTTPRLLGQPVALLIFHDFPRFAVAQRKLRFAPQVMRWAAPTGYNAPKNYGAARFVRIEGPTPDSPDVTSPIKNTIVFGNFVGGANQVDWGKPDEKGNDSGVAMWGAAQIEADIAAIGDDALVLKRRYVSQSVDASAMEADNGNAWLDLTTNTLHAMIATQSSYEVATLVPEMLSKSHLKIDRFDLSIGYTVGYGTKDHTIHPYYVVLAALFADGKPVRLANDRYAQFQMGLKRHAFDMTNTVVVDRNSGKFRILKGEYSANGGGRANFSFTVGMVGATAAQSVYYFPKSDFSISVLASHAVDAGSTRGFGTLQTMSATEMLIDEAAELLKIDPIELRRRNLFLDGMKNTQGAVPNCALRNIEILDAASAHPLWTDRQRRKKEYELRNPGKLYGVGYAQVQKDFGSGAETAISAVSIAPDGAITLRSHGSDIGTGMNTAHAIMVANILGQAPSITEFAITDWPEMPLTSDSRPYTISQSDQDKESRNPYWTPSILSPMSASNSVFFIGQATRQAAAALLRLGLYQAALILWNTTRQNLPFERVKIENAGLSAPGFPALKLSQLAATAHSKGLITGVCVHTFNRWQWAEAEFTVPTAESLRLPIDALSVQYGTGAELAQESAQAGGGYRFIPRDAVYYPATRLNNAEVTYYSSMATIAELAVDTATGKARLLNHHSVLECGNQIVPELVSGQLQGGLAMGIGHALHESLPLYEDGPGNGTWNWNRYHIPRAEDVAVWTQSADILPAQSPDDPPKGMAEVVMIPIVPAIVNAIADATGKRFYQTPVTPTMILEALS